MASQEATCLNDETIKALFQTSCSDELPAWMQTDIHIRNGYRRQLHGVTSCFLSLFHKHNELVNAWSHLGPAAAYLLILLRVDYVFLHDSIGYIQLMDHLMVHLYAASSATCLLLSVSL